MMQYKGFIFDFNGTLFWDTPLHNRAWELFLGKHGYSMSYEEMTHAIHGKMNKDILPAIFQRTLSATETSTLAEEKERIYRELCLTVGMHLAPGATRLLNKLGSMGVKCAIATASPAVNVDFYIQQFGLHQWFDSTAIVCDNGTYRSKPHPDLFLEAAKRLNIAPQNCIIAEDSIAGIEAAKTAGCTKIYGIASPTAIPFDTNVEMISHFDQVDLSLF